MDIATATIKTRQSKEHLINAGNYQNVKLISETTLELNDVPLDRVEELTKKLQEKGRKLVEDDILEQKKALDEADEALFSLAK